MPSYRGIVAALPGPLRLDRYAAEYLQVLTRSQLKSRALSAKLNGRAVKPSRLVRSGDRLDLTWADPEPRDLLPEDLPLELIYEDEQVVVVNKAQGMVVHPGAGNYRGTLANALLFRRLHRGGLEAGEAFRPGIVHRLDKDTSGVLIAAYTDQALAFLSDQFKTRKVRKRYGALVRGSLAAPSGSIETRITRDPRDRKRFTVSQDQGKIALTRYRVIRSWGTYSLLVLGPQTGRTHQLRVHMRHIGHPILGDPLYGIGDPCFSGLSLMLHAKSLRLILPGDSEPRTFKAPLPYRFWDMLRQGRR
ncbi:MAG: RluA family pseudouridine synthase [Treponema sp.]|nr:RluA family pseudouridine synthase [Treponema sp.]